MPLKHNAAARNYSETDHLYTTKHCYESNTTSPHINPTPFSHSHVLTQNQHRAHTILKAPRTLKTKGTQHAHVSIAAREKHTYHTICSYPYTLASETARDTPQSRKPRTYESAARIQYIVDVSSTTLRPSLIDTDTIPPAKKNLVRLDTFDTAARNPAAAHDTLLPLHTSIGTYLRAGKSWCFLMLSMWTHAFDPHRMVSYQAITHPRPRREDHSSKESPDDSRYSQCFQRFRNHRTCPYRHCTQPLHCFDQVQGPRIG